MLQVNHARQAASPIQPDALEPLPLSRPEPRANACGGPGDGRPAQGAAETLVSVSAGALIYSIGGIDFSSCRLHG